MLLAMDSRDIAMQENRFQVNTPDYPFENTYACLSKEGNLFLYADREDLKELGMVLQAAASCSGETYYLPLRQHGLTEYLCARDGRRAQRDLLILNNGLTMDSRRWKEIRLNLSECRPSKINRVVNPDTDADEHISHEIYRIFGCNKEQDVLYLKSCDDTILMTGSDKVLQGLAENCLSLAQSEPAAFCGEMPEYHSHTHLDRLMGKHEDTCVCLLYYDKNLWGW